MPSPPRIASVALASAAVATTALVIAPLAASSPSTDQAAPPAISSDDIMPHLRALATIADQNGGNRAAGTRGYEASVQYVERDLAAAGLRTQRQRCTTCRNPSDNIWTDLVGTDPSTEYVFGAHLDSVKRGPGINDNASGSGLLLEVAKRLKASGLRPKATIRFIWFTSEETGLQGSAFYVRSLGAAKSKIKTYFNFDMTASPNGGLFMVNHDKPTSQPLRAYMDQHGIAVEEDKLGRNRQDDASFTRAGIMSTGFATGAEEKGTAEWNAKWGIKEGQSLDPCYHQRCDTLNNVQPSLLHVIAQATMQAAWTVAQ